MPFCRLVPRAIAVSWSDSFATTRNRPRKQPSRTCFRRGSSAPPLASCAPNARSRASGVEVPPSPRLLGTPSFSMSRGDSILRGPAKSVSPLPGAGAARRRPSTPRRARRQPRTSLAGPGRPRPVRDESKLRYVAELSRLSSEHYLGSVVPGRSPHASTGVGGGVVPHRGRPGGMAARARAQRPRAARKRPLPRSIEPRIGLEQSVSPPTRRSCAPSWPAHGRTLAGPAGPGGNSPRSWRSSMVFPTRGGRSPP